MKRIEGNIYKSYHIFKRRIHPPSIPTVYRAGYTTSQEENGKENIKSPYVHHHPWCECVRTLTPTTFLFTVLSLRLISAIPPPHFFLFIYIARQENTPTIVKIPNPPFPFQSNFDTNWHEEEKQNFKWTKKVHGYGIIREENFWTPPKTTLAVVWQLEMT